MNKKTVFVTIIVIVFLAGFITAASFAFFANKDDSHILEIGSNDQFKVSVSVGETQGQLIPVKAENDNTAGVVLSDSDGVRIAIPYTIIADGVESISFSLKADSVMWQNEDGSALNTELAEYLKDKLDFAFYVGNAQNINPAYTPDDVVWKGFDSALEDDQELASFTLQSGQGVDLSKNQEGTMILAIRFNVPDELLALDEIMNKVIAMTVLSSYTTSVGQ